MPSGVCAGHQHGPEHDVQSLALGMQLPIGMCGRGFVSQPVSKIVEIWFESYKGPGKVEAQGFAGPDDAREIIAAAAAAAAAFKQP